MCPFQLYTRSQGYKPSVPRDPSEFTVSSRQSRSPLFPGSHTPHSNGTGVAHNGTLGHQMSVSVQILWPIFFKFLGSHPFSCLVTQVMAMDSFLKRAGDDTTKYTRYNVADLQSMAQVQKLGKEW